MMKVKIKPFESVDKALKVLDPADNNWYQWIFRGQADSNFELKPSIWREGDKFNRFVEQRISYEITEEIQNKCKENSLTDAQIKNVITWDSWVRFENEMLYSFYRIANDAGLKIAGNFLSSLNKKDLSSKPSLKLYIDHFSNYLGQKKKPILYKLPLRFEAALPQHHGLPTRLLDWTSNPRKALFFAAYTYMKDYHKYDNQHRHPKDMAVYALKRKNQKKENEPFTREGCQLIKGYNPINIKKTYLRSENQFLHCQDGIFTEIYGDFYFFENGCWPSVEDLLYKTGGEYFEIQKFSIGVVFAEKILECLDPCGISISKLMPDYNHVAEQAKHELKLI